MSKKKTARPRGLADENADSDNNNNESFYSDLTRNLNQSISGDYLC